MSFISRHLSLKEKASMFHSLVREPGWELLQQSFRPEIRTRITDIDAREAFLYEAIRVQVLNEVFSTPDMVMAQANKQRGSDIETENGNPIEWN